MGKDKKKESRLKVDTTEAVRIDSEIVGQVREHKKNGGPAVGLFFEIAAKEKLAKDKIRNAEKV